MVGGGVTLFNSSISGSSVGLSFMFSGGRSALVVAATQYGGGVSAQLQTANGRWIPICSTLVSDQMFTFDAPQGQYRLISNQGSSIGLVATLTTIPY